MHKDASLNSGLSSETWAIKIGGSLYNSHYLVQWLDAISECSSKKIAIIPGGGPFADQVRLADEKFNMDQASSHGMAVMAMQQYGSLLASQCVGLATARTTEQIHQAWSESKAVIWEPYEMVRDQCTLDKTWDITSDSLAVWLTSILEIKNLLLIKSSKQVLETTNLEILAKNGCIDPALQELVNNYQIDIHVLHKSKVKNLYEMLISA
ncbi:MAG: uridylate kinase [Gammaproteobacteria bacterium]|nr:uridylate kinase [Gammaproteobacteria bacterium]